jgi:hypothetical protein
MRRASKDWQTVGKDDRAAAQYMEMIGDPMGGEHAAALAGFLPQPFLGLLPLGGLDIALHAATAILAVAAGWLYRPRPAAIA